MPYTMTPEQWKAAILRCANARIKHILSKGEPRHMTGKGVSGFATIAGESPASPANQG